MPGFDFGNIAGFLGHGLMSQFAPSIIKGILVELFQSHHIDTKELCSMIQNDISLWSKVGPEDQSKIKRLVSNIGNIDWFTADWLIESLRKDVPTLCSLFLGWEEAYKWLECQVVEIKEQLITKITT